MNVQEALRQYPYLLNWCFAAAAAAWLSPGTRET
jgi:hypothetical protein